MKRIIILVFIFFAFYSCDTVDHFGNTDDTIAGQWNWVRTDGGIAFHIHETPESTGKSVRLILTENNKFALIENNTEVLSGTYKLFLKNSIYSGDQEPFIELSEQDQIQAVVLNGIVQIISADTLTISDNMYDGVGSTFTRVYSPVLH